MRKHSFRTESGGILGDMNHPVSWPAAPDRPGLPAGAPARALPEPVADSPDYHRQGVARRRRIDLIDVALTVLCVVPVAVFVAQDGIDTLTSVPGFVKSVGMLTGLVAMALLLEMVLLAARIPFVDHAIGHDHALLKHRRLTVAALILLFVHAIGLLVSYAMTDKLGLFAEFSGLWTLGDFVLAVLGLGLFCLVGMTSWTVTKRHLPHEGWFVLHLLSYAALAVSIPHQFSMSGMFATGLARWYWMGFIAVTAFCLLHFRVLTPLFNSLDHRLFVSATEPAGPDTVNIYLSGRNLRGLGLQAGQFFHFRFLTRRLWWHEHPFSTSSGLFTNAAGQDTFRITVRNLGKGTAELIRVRPGANVSFEGPYGVFSDRARTRDDLVLVGAGVGIAPIRALLDGTNTVPGRALVVLRARTPTELFLLDEFRVSCALRGITLVTLIGDPGTNVRTGLSWSSIHQPTLRLAELAPWAPDADIFICGPQQWADQTIAEAVACGVPRTQIHDERFAW